MRTNRRELLALMLSVAACTAALAAQDAPPLSARFAVTTIAAAVAGQPSVRRNSVWTFHRSADQVALLKGAIDEVWSRDAAGRISFQRVFHEHRKVTDYSAGELATLGVRVDWASLATLVNAAEMAALKQTARRGSGTSLRLQLEGRSGDEHLRIDWLPTLQLPALVLRTNRNGGSTRIELIAHAAPAPADWPQAGTRSADYLHLDAADFGDMDYEPVVRLSEALDVRGGWRKPHSHD